MSKIIVDISDLVDWYKHHINVTGIQIVVEQIFTQDKYFDNEKIKFVFRFANGGEFYSIDTNIIFMLVNPENKTQAVQKIRAFEPQPSITKKIMELIGKLKSRPLFIFPWAITQLVSLPHRLYRLLFDYLYAKKNHNEHINIFKFQGGETCIIPGAFWHLDDTSAVYKKLKKEKNIKVFLFVYDLIPISHRHFFEDSLSRSFKMQLDVFLPIADNMLSISQHTKAEIEEYAAAQEMSPPPIRVINFGFVSDVLSIDPELETDTLKALNLDEVDFALCVGTIEPRKNLGLLLEVWKSLFRISGDKTPTLVLAGRRGWKMDWFFDELLKCNYLDGKIRVMHNLSDRDLALLYHKTKVVLFPSFVEGWGLPVEEAVAFGKYTLASNRSSIPEAGRDCAFYFDPHDNNRLQEELIKCFGDLNYISKKEMFISAKRAEYARNFTWQKTAEQVLDVVSAE